jgi:hypothetical protein
MNPNGSSRRETPFHDERLSGGDHHRGIHCEHADGGPADWCQADEHRPLPVEVIAPAVSARVVEPGQLPGRRVESGDVRALVEIAVNARNREVRRIVVLFMLFGDDVIDLVWAPRGRLREPTVFAARARRRTSRSTSAVMATISPA